MKFLDKINEVKIVVLMIGAVILLSSCGEKEVKTPVKPVQEVAVTKPVSTEKPMAPKEAVKITENLEAIDGSKVYKKCQTCHGRTGEGIPGVYPPLAKRLASLLDNDAGREYLALVVINGVRGDINIDGTRYRGTMPRQGGMTPGKTAAVLNYIMTDFNAVIADGSNLFTIDEIIEITTVNGRMSSQNVYKKRTNAFGE